MRDILTEIQRRKDAREDPCDDCNGTGVAGPYGACSSCLGQGILLTAYEYRELLRIAGWVASDFDGDAAYPAVALITV